MLAALSEARPAWHLELVTSGDGPLLDRAVRMGIPSIALKFPPSLARLGEWGQRGSAMARVRLGAAVCRAAIPALRYASHLGRHLERAQPDIVHTNGLKMHLLAARCRASHAKLVWHLHDYPDARPMTAALLRGQARRCDEVLANSDSVAEHSRRLFGSAVPVRTLYNSVDLNRFQPDGAKLDLDARAGMPPFAAGGIRIGLVGTFARWKGHEIFLDALSRLHAPLPVRAYIVGDQIYETARSQFSRSELAAAAASRGLKDSVGFTGGVDDVPGAMRALDIVVHASTEPEPFGLVIAEAMACGRPVIVSRGGGAAEIASAGALFHEPGNAADLAARLSDLIGDPALRAALGAAGRVAAVRLFGRPRLCSTLIPIYESLAPQSAAA
jgi:glycosyltransferase involved in cell wall biosynthesis